MGPAAFSKMACFRTVFGNALFYLMLTGCELCERPLEPLVQMAESFAGEMKKDSLKAVRAIEQSVTTGLRPARGTSSLPERHVCGENFLLADVDDLDDKILVPRRRRRQEDRRARG